MIFLDCLLYYSNFLGVKELTNSVTWSLYTLDYYCSYLLCNDLFHWLFPLFAFFSQQFFSSRLPSSSLFFSPSLSSFIIFTTLPPSLSIYFLVLSIASIFYHRFVWFPSTGCGPLFNRTSVPKEFSNFSTSWVPWFLYNWRHRLISRGLNRIGK